MAAILSRVGETPAAREQRERQESMPAERKTLTDVVNVAQPEPLERPRRRL